jgi:hypothetical protein
MDRNRTLAALGMVAALAMPTAAIAENDNAGHGKGAEHGKKAKKPKTDTYVFKGAVSAVAGGTVQVQVAAGNNRGRKYKGQTLSFDLAKAKVKVRDANGDGKRDLADVAVGDRVLIQAKLPRGALDVSQALPARQFLDKGPVKPKHAPAENEDHPAPESEPAG